MKLDLNCIKNLAENIEKYGLNEVSVESDGVKVILKREKPGQPYQQSERTGRFEGESGSGAADPVPAEEAISDVKETEGETINAPMTGTFYRAPAPGSPPFVAAGQEVLEGATLCILEAMKLMNEVKAPGNCKIVKILAEDGQIVRKGDKLFAVKK